MSRLASLLGAPFLALATFASGCSFEHFAAVDYEHMPQKIDGYDVVGFVHAETWTPAVFWVFPLLPGQNAEKAKRMALAKAQSMGADGVTDVRLYTETHSNWWLLYFVGWVENHITATAIKN
jgi:hypothetical protein